MSDVVPAVVPTTGLQASLADRSLTARSLASVWHPCTQMKAHQQVPLLPIARGQGVWLYDFDGRRYLDAVSSWWVNLFGHGNPRIHAAIKDQLDQIAHVMLAGCTHEPVVELSERLSALTGHHLGHCFYASDGASATEIALKMSFHYWRNAGLVAKNRYVAVQHGYHGETIGSLSVTDVAVFKDAYAPLLRQADNVPSPDWRLAEPGESAETYALRCAAALGLYLEEHHGQTAALIVEPLVQCAAGMAMHHSAYLRRARELCDQYQIHLIADEIAVGFGRTGTMFAHEQANIGPDFLCLSKGISGGTLPLSVVMTTDKIYQAFYADELTRGFLHSHSYTGNALACRAALAVLDIFEHDDVLNANRVTAAHINSLAQPLSTHPKISNFRQCGMIWAFDVCNEVANEDPLFAQRFHVAALQHELLLRPIGNTVYFMPPYIISSDEAALMVERTLAMVNQFTKAG